MLRIGPEHTQWWEEGIDLTKKKRKKAILMRGPRRADQMKIEGVDKVVAYLISYLKIFKRFR